MAFRGASCFLRLGCELWGHSFEYNASKSAELISFEWVRFMATMHLNLPQLQRDMQHGNIKQDYALDWMCKRLLRGKSLTDYNHMMKPFPKPYQRNVYYVLQMLASKYISFELCSVLKKQLFDVSLIMTVMGGMPSKIAYEMLCDYNRYVISFSVNLSSVEVSGKVSNIRNSKESCYDDLGSFTDLQMLLMYFNSLSPEFIRVIFLNELNEIDQLMFNDMLIHVSRIHVVIDKEVKFLKKRRCCDNKKKI